MRDVFFSLMTLPIHSPLRTGPYILHVLTLMYSERPKLYGVLAVLSAIGLRYYMHIEGIIMCTSNSNGDDGGCDS